jgi:hypothetical protein
MDDHLCEIGPPCTNRLLQSAGGAMSFSERLVTGQSHGEVRDKSARLAIELQLRRSAPADLFGQLRDRGQMELALFSRGRFRGAGRAQRFQVHVHGVDLWKLQSNRLLYLICNFVGFPQ